ncbi:MAG: hypothetical protein A2998_02825 [Candidatus Staskawiczbacteria bacterium RIFCSPLOWO2_01_FULL_37_25b]|uniref:DUF4190 domain-containing protein n=2 Tax=Parcubacteria group TaxID=1794811 RepID=A0A1F8F6M7_9BACT|nr:MAG: hypothetical protein A3C61_03030 [Candidatus Yanofskybacteria bacterium RIFCSPHIGHO2_02_FULL_39_10]OGZ71320.1 MAG: hypothetical protein A2998_02825 [Candidatus Staskawiczbacteria bacterium RIFCSPLOWO2_01_FULL_37_25b]
MKKIVTIGLLAIFLVGLHSVANAVSPFCIPGPAYDAKLCYEDTTSPTGTGSATDTSEIFEILQSIGGFLLVAAGIIAGVVIIISGLVWMASGSNTARVTTAKAIFKNGIIGALIIFAAGLIINTIILIGTDWTGFFN